MAIKTIHKIPTLEEALLLVKGKILVNLDKADRYFDMVVPLLIKLKTFLIKIISCKSNRYKAIIDC